MALVNRPLWWAPLLLILSCDYTPYEKSSRRTSGKRYQEPLAPSSADGEVPVRPSEASPSPSPSPATNPKPESQPLPEVKNEPEESLPSESVPEIPKSQLGWSGEDHQVPEAIRLIVMD